IEIVRRIRIRHVHHLAAARRNADCLRVADILDLGLERAVVIEHLDALVAAVGGVDVALGINGDAVDAGELTGGAAALAPLLDEHAVLRELGDARVAAAVGDEDVALRIPRDVGRSIEDVLLRAGSRRPAGRLQRSEEHTSELQSPYDLVCRLLLEKKKQKTKSALGYPV